MKYECFALCWKCFSRNSSRAFFRFKCENSWEQTGLNWNGSCFNILLIFFAMQRNGRMFQKGFSPKLLLEFLCNLLVRGFHSSNEMSFQSLWLSITMLTKQQMELYIILIMNKCGIYKEDVNVGPRGDLSTWNCSVPLPFYG